MRILLTLLSAAMLLTGTADAKWWIFGKTDARIGIRNLKINGLSTGEAGDRVKIFSGSLGPDGLAKIAGSAITGKGTLGSVRITLDNKATWQDAKFSENGDFEYSFRPEAGKTYVMFIEIANSTGKTNKIDQTRKEISISAENVQARVREALDSLFDAYNRENLQRFMAWVGEDFAGSKPVLESAVKRDFEALSNIVMRYTINNVAAGQGGRVFVSVTFNRMVMLNKTGTINTDSGTTEFVFNSTSGKLSLFSMKRPLVFGLSDSENVATGRVPDDNSGLLTLDPDITP